jgi:hypothetical protein
MLVDQRGTGRLLIAAVMAGLVLRLAFGLIYWTGKPLTHDEQEYLSLARSLTAGQGFVYDAALETGTGARFGRAPGYPAFLAAIGAGTSVVESVPARVKVVQAFVGAAGIWLIGCLAARSYGARAGVVGSWIAAAYPPLISMPAYALSETLASTLALAAALMLQQVASTPQRGRFGSGLAAAAGFLSGTAILIRPATAVYLPLAALWLLTRRQWRAALVVVGVTAMVIVPWTIRNLGVYDRPVLIASDGGVTFWTGNHPLAIGEGDLAANPAIKRDDLQFRGEHPGLSAEALEPLYYRAALTHIREHPVWWIGLLLRKCFYLVVPVGPSYALHSTRYRVATTAPYLLLLPFAVASLRRVRRASEPPTAVLLLAASAVLTCLVFFPQERFRVPLIDPALIVCAAGAVVRLRPRP